MVLHKSKRRPNAFGGTTQTTLCGRMALGGDGMNIAASDDAVTCKICLFRLANLVAHREQCQPCREAASSSAQ